MKKKSNIFFTKAMVAFSTFFMVGAVLTIQSGEARELSGRSIASSKHLTAAERARLNPSGQGHRVVPPRAGPVMHNTNVTPVERQRLRDSRLGANAAVDRKVAGRAMKECKRFIRANQGRSVGGVGRNVGMTPLGAYFCGAMAEKCLLPHMRGGVASPAADEAMMRCIASEWPKHLADWRVA